MSNFFKQIPQKNKKIIIISIIAALLVIGIVITLFLIYSKNNENTDNTPNTPEAVAQKFVDSYCSFDAQKMITCYPEFIWADDYMEEILLLSLQDFLNYAKPSSPSCLSIEMIKPDEEELAKINQDLEAYTNIVEGFDLNCISEITTAYVSFTKIETNGQSYTDSETLVLINYNGKWCVFFPYFL